MQTPASPTADTDQGDVDTWPWQCLDCGETIYHDGELCRDCAASSRPATYADEANAPREFVDWMCEQSVPGFVLKVSALAAIELSLTAFWLQSAFWGSIHLPSAVPGIV